MDFRRTKLGLALAVMAMGMVIAVAWHSYQGLILGKGYPANTFLFYPGCRFSDLFVPMIAANMPTPYEIRVSAYFPFAYSLTRCVSHLDPLTVAVGYLCLSTAGLWIVLLQAFRPIIRSFWENFVASTGFLIFSYPFLFCFDRANLELIMALLISGALLCFKTRRWTLGASYLAPTIFMKLYPVLLTVVLVRRGHCRKLFVIGFLFVFLNFLCLLSFQGTLIHNLTLWRDCMGFYRDDYVIHNAGLDGSASPWNMTKSIMMAFWHSKIWSNLLFSMR